METRREENLFLVTLLLLSSLANQPVSTHNISPHNLNDLPARDDLKTVIDTCEQRTDSS